MLLERKTLYQRRHYGYSKGLSNWALLELTLLGLCLLSYEVNGRILVIRRETNQIIEEYNDVPAAFGPSLPGNGIKVYAIPAMPIPPPFYQTDNFACHKIAKAPTTLYPEHAKFVVIIQRGNCTFETKVRTAQAALYHAAIVYNNDGDDLEQMSADNSSGIRIPAVFVGQSSGENLSNFYTDEVVIVINDELPFNINTQLIIPFAILIGLCFLIMIFYMVYKCIREERRLRRNLLPKKMLKKLPILKYTKNSNFVHDRCVICLDDFAEGDKIRILPCRHPYHSNCIDPWLTENRRTCPICKRKVFTKAEARTPWNRQVSLDSVTDSDDDTTPLLQPPRNSTTNTSANNSSNLNNSTNDSSSTRHGTFTRSNITSGNAAAVEPSAENLSNEFYSADDNAHLIDSNATANQAGRINPFDRTRNATSETSEQAPQGSRSIWSYPILRLFRRREPLSIAAPPFNDNANIDIENQRSTQSSQQPLMVSNNILNPNLSGSFKAETNETIPNNEGDNSSTDEGILIPHHNIYEPEPEPIDIVIANDNPSQQTEIPIGNNQENDSMFIQTPTQGGIGVVALPNANNTNDDLLVTTVQPSQQENNALGHQRYRRGFHI